MHGHHHWGRFPCFRILGGYPQKLWFEKKIWIFAIFRFSNISQIKWAKSEEQSEFGGRWFSLTWTCPPSHGSSEGHFMLRRHDTCRLIANIQLIPKMFFFYQNRQWSMVFKKCVFVPYTVSFSLVVWFHHVLNSRYILPSPTKYIPLEEPYPSQKKTMHNTKHTCFSWH